MSRIIYVLLLETGKIFVYSSPSENHSQVKMECEMLYGFSKIYKPVCILNQYWNCEIEDVDKYVKKYMTIVGIDSVRGGSYQDLILPEHCIKTLQSEIDYIRNGEENEKKINDFLRANIKDTLTLEKVNAELTSELSQYKETKDILNSLTYFMVDGVQYEFRLSIMEKIQWLQNISGNVETIDEDMKQKYNDILVYLRNIARVNIEWRELCLENNEQLLYPELVFDPIFYKTTKLATENNKQDAINLCKMYETFLYWILNRIDEYKFDLTNYREQLHWKTEIVNFLSNSISTHQ
jgi:hypothetical protein